MKVGMRQTGQFATARLVHQAPPGVSAGQGGNVRVGAERLNLRSVLLWMD